MGRGASDCFFARGTTRDTYQMRVSPILPRMNLYTKRLSTRMNPGVEGAAATSYRITSYVHPIKPGEDRRGRRANLLLGGLPVRTRI